MVGGSITEPKLKVMKKLLVLLISAVSLNGMAQDNPKNLNVLASNGLNMRVEPDSKSRIVSKVGYGKQVEIVQKSKVELQLGWVKDHWYKIKYRGREGYIFGGYLGTLPAPVKTENNVLADLLPVYCASSFKMAGEQINSAEPASSGDTLHYSLLMFTNGAELELENIGNRRTTTLLLKQDLQSTYVLLEALLKTSNHAETLDELKFVNGKDGLLTRISNSERTVSVKKVSANLTELKLTSHMVSN